MDLGRAIVGQVTTRDVRRLKRRAETVAAALTAITGQPVARDVFDGLDQPHPVVAELDGPTAHAVVAHVRAEVSAVSAQSIGRCHYCGLPYAGTSCRECV